MKLHRNTCPGEVSKCSHADQWPEASTWPRASCAAGSARMSGNPNNRLFAGRIRPTLPAVPDKTLTAQLAGAWLDRPAIHAQPCRQFIGGKTIVASIANCRFRHALEPPKFGSKGVGSDDGGFHTPVARCIRIACRWSGGDDRVIELPPAFDAASRPAIGKWWQSMPPKQLHQPVALVVAQD